MFSPSSDINPCHSYFLIGIICGPIWGSFPARDHFRSGIICGSIWGSFAVRDHLRSWDHLRTRTDLSSMVAFSVTHQILTIPQSQPLAREHQGENDLYLGDSENFPGSFLRNGLSGVIITPLIVVMTTPTRYFTAGLLPQPQNDQ